MLIFGNKLFKKPLHILKAFNNEEFLTAFREIEELSKKYYLAGYIRYEAKEVFLGKKIASDYPLLYFEVFEDFKGFSPHVADLYRLKSSSAITFEQYKSDLEKIKKEIANCAPRVLASKNEASVPPGKEFAISIPNIQKELGIVKKGVNRKKATDWISTEQPDWLIPKEKVDNLLSAPNVANEEDLVKLKSENPTYYQTAADKDLVAYHNVSTGKLRETIKLGGLPMPSLAITKRDIP